MFRRARRKVINFFENFTKTAARERAVRAVRREEKTLGQRLAYWERRHEGRAAADPRRDVSSLNTNQLKAYARELHRYRGAAIKSAGVVSPAGHLLRETDVDFYETAWAAREIEKDFWRKALELEGVDYTKKALTLIDIDPRTGKPKPTYGGNFVLTRLGDPELPDTQDTLERRSTLMRGWKSVRSRLDTSEDNVRSYLVGNDDVALELWDSLTRAQKQYLINFEGIFDIVKALNFETPKTSKHNKRLSLYTRTADDGRREELYQMLRDAASMRAVRPDLAEISERS